MSFWTIDATGQTWLHVPQFDPGANDIEVPSESASPLSDAYELTDTKHGSVYLNVCRSIIKHALRNGEVWEPHVTKLLERHAVLGSTVLDIGAHNGVHTLTMAKAVGERGRVYAFEPQAKIYQELRANLQANHASNVRTIHAAVGANEKVETLFPALDEAKTCTSAAFVTLSSSKDEDGVRIGPGAERVQAFSLDSFQFRNVSLVKIDVEGAERAVLSGATNTLKREQPVVIIEIQGGYEFGTATKAKRAEIYQTIQMLEDLNYQVIQLEKWDYLAFPIA